MKNKILLFVICLLCFFGFKINSKALDKDIPSLHYNQTVVDTIISRVNQLQGYNQIYLILYNNVDGKYYFPVRRYDPGHSSDDSFIIWYVRTQTTNADYYSYLITNGGYSTRLDFYSYDLSTNVFEDVSNSNFLANFPNSTQSWQAFQSLKYYPPKSPYFDYDIVYCSTYLIANNYITNLPINDYNVSAGDHIYIIPPQAPPTPEISISNLTPIKDNYENIVKYNVNFSTNVFDTSLYDYEYCLNNICDDITSNNSTIDLNSNGTYIFKIIDKSDSSIVDSSSLTISNIFEESPYIKYSFSVPPSCQAFIDNQNRNVCKRLFMEWGINNGSYFYQYSVNNLDFENIYGSYSINLVQGDSVILRVIDTSDNVVWTSSFTINDLYTIDASLGIFATFNLTSFGYSDYNSNYVEIYLYNLNIDFINNVYISYNGYNFELLDISNRGGYFFGITKDITKNQQIYLNVKNNNNEIIYSTSYYVDLTSSSKPSLLTFLENFNLSMSGPISNLVTAPIRLISNLTDYYGSCTPLNLPSAIGNLSLPCMSEVYTSISIDLYNIIRLIFDGIICYYCSLNIIHTFKNLVSPTDDRIEVIDL